MQIMDDVSVVSVYTDAYDGGLGDCTTIVDTHVRLLADRLLRGNAATTSACYQRLLDVRLACPLSPALVLHCYLHVSGD